MKSCEVFNSIQLSVTYVKHVCKMNAKADRISQLVVSYQVCTLTEWNQKEERKGREKKKERKKEKRKKGKEKSKTKRKKKKLKPKEKRKK